MSKERPENIAWMPSIEAAENGWIIRYSERGEQPAGRPFDPGPVSDCTEVFKAAETDKCFKRYQELCESYRNSRYREGSGARS